MALIMMAGCAKMTFKEGSQTAASIQRVEQESLLVKEHVNGTVAALDHMFNDQQGDLKEQFKTYSKSIDDLEAQAKRVRSRVDTMKSQKDDYLQQWNNQLSTIESETVRQTAEQRRQTVEEMFTNVQREMDEAGKVFQPFISKLNDIRTAMNMDLNRNGLNAMRSIADQARAEAKVISARLDAVISVLSKAATALTGTS
jgi:chromosome segregation ATPase